MNVLKVSCHFRLRSLILTHSLRLWVFALIRSSATFLGPYQQRRTRLVVGNSPASLTYPGGPGGVRRILPRLIVTVGGSTAVVCFRLR
jgi:hypothetical protein